jgi:uncharacterized protein YabN with tetrapyrrole methylase and pyrophosphatase domain
MKDASLVVVGTGIKFLSHITIEVRAYIKQSNKVFFLVNEPAIKEWILSNHQQAESLDDLYFSHHLRKDSYIAITNYILEALRKIQHICVVFYGHPGVFVQSGIEAIKLARSQGFYAKMLPGISAEACLFADLLIDPGSSGCHSFEATDFLLYKRKFDPRGHLILWQVDIIGVLNNPLKHDNKKGAQLLLQHLLNYYPEKHQVVLYEAAQYPMIEPSILKMKLIDLPHSNFSKISTLYVPPIKDNWYDEEFIRKLEINIDNL